MRVDLRRYEPEERRFRALARRRDQAAAIALYNSAFKAAYDAASDALDALTARNFANARRASLRKNVVYRGAWWLILITIGLTGLSVAGAMAYVRRSISAPILGLAERMHRLAADDTGSDMQSTERPDEIGEMARAVMVFRSNAIELMNSPIGLERQATMLRERLAEEQRLMLLQRNFVSMASHEFRTPITIIDGLAQRLITMKDRLTSDDLAERARSPGGGLINVVLEPGESWVVVSVRDRGMGIPESDRARLFERYYRGSNAAGIVGTGLGLYFVKTVVALHGGQVTAESQEGEASCFQVRLPSIQSRSTIGCESGQHIRVRQCRVVNRPRSRRR